ncbi:hypothetical protein ACA910_007368 [Epithemia clementina (nom. ined.)]
MDVNDPGDIVDDPQRFKESRAGDSLMCPFQCDLCSFYNIWGRYPDEARFDKDWLLLLCIRQANLDAFWARECSTVARNQTEMHGLLNLADMLGIQDPLPNRGPFPVADTFGMGTACTMLMKTLRAGRNAEQIQFETALKVRAVVSNFVHTTPYGVGASTIGHGECGGQFFSGSPTNSQWFKRFMSGCHRRMGNVWVPDKAVTLDEILAALTILQDEYLKLTHGQRRLEVALTGSMLVTGYAAALRGEEISLIDIGMVQKYWAEGRDYRRTPHVPLALVGRFKQTNGVLKTFIQPLAPPTASGIQIQTWIG